MGSGRLGPARGARSGRGEIRAHRHLADAGWRRVGRNPPADVYAKGHRGIDGIYHRAGERPPWLVVEAKYGKGDLSRKQTSTGRQMEKRWVESRLGDALNEDAALVDRISSENYQRRLIHVDYDGSVTMKSLDHMK